MNDTGLMVQRSTSRDRYGLCFQRARLIEVVELAFAPIDAPQLFCTCNLNHLRLLQSDRAFQRAYRLAVVVTVDSRPLQMLARFQCGEALPLVTGADLFPALIARLRPGLDRPFFVTSSDDAGSTLVRQLVTRGFAPEAVGYFSPPFGFQDNDVHSADLIDRIQALGTTHLFMGVGAPKSERWIASKFVQLPSARIFCVGAALDFTSGLKRRAPLWVRRFSLEWLHRLLSEPKRLIPRYLGDALFLLKVMSGHRLVQICPPPGISGEDHDASPAPSIA
ncbi:WecB/TagA/CpsF family glycosyltransferase [Sphingomonas sp. HMP9]|uniref:WecB/TagA/CpsF family glycosyltransferase n=1 Tax=Sphingomonas sp. HMP9 TaxID=1517554 RepID=UPI00159682D9|nr:WecB/TagA/CpsF family glycosyltransferase [Sphingomonas sp. HMP9]